CVLLSRFDRGSTQNDLYVVGWRQHIMARPRGKSETREERLRPARAAREEQRRASSSASLSDGHAPNASQTRENRATPPGSNAHERHEAPNMLAWAYSSRSEDDALHPALRRPVAGLRISSRPWPAHRTHSR